MYKSLLFGVFAALLLSVAGCSEPDPASQPGFNPNTEEDPDSVMNAMPPGGDTKKVDTTVPEASKVNP